jgi:hypothetical protein
MANEGVLLNNNGWVLGASELQYGSRIDGHTTCNEAYRRQHRDSGLWKSVPNKRSLRWHAHISAQVHINSS